MFDTSNPQKNNLKIAPKVIKVLISFLLKSCCHQKRTVVLPNAKSTSLRMNYSKLWSCFYYVKSFCWLLQFYFF